ncbi:MAG: hypothetical protein ACUZ8E_08915 [Candidatus Anammoxibacter sp.]
MSILSKSKNKMTPEKRVGKTANTIIFIGILYSFLSLFAITLFPSLLERGFGFKSIIAGLIIIGLGYGIRYGSSICLYVSTAVFIFLPLYFLNQYTSTRHVNYLFRIICGLWILCAIARSIPAMITLKANGSLPDRTSKYKNFFLRRKQSLERN